MAGATRSSVERNVEAYVKELPQLLKNRQEGKFALIKSAEVVGVLESYEQASQAGEAKYGHGFMIKEISSADLVAGRAWLQACPS